MLTRLLIVLLLGAAIRAEIMVAQSLDWLILSCPQIAQVKSDGVGCQLITRLKGAETPSQFPCKTGLKGELLVFLRGDTLIYGLSLEHPPDKGERAAYTSDFRVLRTRNEILDYVARHLRDQGGESKKVEVPPGTEAFKALYSGSTCYLIVPR